MKTVVETMNEAYEKNPVWREKKTVHILMGVMSTTVPEDFCWFVRGALLGSCLDIPLKGVHYRYFDDASDSEIFEFVNKVLKGEEWVR